MYPSTQLFVFVFPELRHPFGDLRFGGVLGVGFVEFCPRERFRHELYFGEMPCVVVGIFISFAVTRLVHQLRRGVAQVQRHRTVRRVVLDQRRRLYT